MKRVPLCPVLLGARSQHDLEFVGLERELWHLESLSQSLKEQVAPLRGIVQLADALQVPQKSPTMSNRAI